MNLNSIMLSEKSKFKISNTIYSVLEKDKTIVRTHQWLPGVRNGGGRFFLGEGTILCPDHDSSPPRAPRLNYNAVFFKIKPFFRFSFISD